MTLCCSKCDKKNTCKDICSELKKQITGRGLTAAPKPKTYIVDFDKIQNPHENLNDFQKEILNTILKSSRNMKNIILTLIINEAIEGTLTKREKEIIHLRYMENLTLTEIAFIIGVTQPRISALLKRSLKKLRAFLEQDKKCLLATRE